LSVETTESKNSGVGRPKEDREKIWQLLNSKFCYYCGEVVSKDAEKCVRCGKRRLNPFTSSKIAKRLRISVATVYRAKLEMPENYEALYKELPDDFYGCESITKWENDIRLSGSLSALELLRVIRRICYGEILEEFKCHPDRFDLEKAKEFILAYTKKFGKEKVNKYYRMAIRHFLMSKGIAIQKGMGKAAGLSVEKEHFGDYAHIKLSDEEIEKAREHLKNDLESLLFFDLSIESGARATALIECEVSKIEKQNGFMTLQIYESKTKKTWTKYLMVKKYQHAKETKEELETYIAQHPQRKRLFIENDMGSQIFARKIATKLEEAYQHLGKTDKYFYMKPIHTLRHIVAHLWLRRTKYDYGLVSIIGGWDDVQTLIKCYGAMPPEIVLSKINALEESECYLRMKQLVETREMPLCSAYRDLAALEQLNCVSFQ